MREASRKPHGNKRRPAMVVCPVHGESKVEQVQKVLDKLSDEDLQVLADADPNMVAIKIASAVSLVSGNRCLAMMRERQKQFDAPPAN